MAAEVSFVIKVIVSAITKDQSNSYFFGIKDVNTAGGGLRDVALLNFTPLAQINRLNNILLGHFKEIGKIYCTPLGCLCILFIPSAPK